MYLILVAIFMGIISLYLMNKTIKFETKLMDSLKRIERKLKI